MFSLLDDVRLHHDNWDASLRRCREQIEAAEADARREALEEAAKIPSPSCTIYPEWSSARTQRESYKAFRAAIRARAAEEE